MPPDLINFTLVRYALKACVADKMIWALLIVFATTVSVSSFLGDASVIEQVQFSLVFCAGTLRMVAVLGLVLFIAFFIRRSFESRDIEFLLSRPVTKFSLLSSYAFAFSILAASLAAFVAGCVYIMMPDGGLQGFMFWSLSILSELWIIAVVAFFFASLLSSSAASVLVTLLFYVLGRLMGQILSILETAYMQSLPSEIMSVVMQGISMLVPRFDLMGQTSWLLYDVQGGATWLFLVLQPLLYNALIFTALTYDFRKRQF